MNKVLLLAGCLLCASLAPTPVVAQADSTTRTYDEWVSESFDWLDQDSLARAAVALRNALRLEPAHPQNGLLLTNLGTLQRQLGQYAEAEMSYTAAMALLPDHAGLLRNRASLYAETEQYAKAINDYTDLILRDAEDEDAYYQRALCRLMSNDTLGARMDLEAINRFKPLSAKARLGMAYVYKAQGEYGLAADLYNALIEANPKSPTLFRERAEVYYCSGRMGAALSDVNQSLQLNPHDPMSYYLRAQIRYARGDKEFARRDLRQAVETGLPPAVARSLEQKLR